MSEQISWSAPKGTRNGLKMLADKAGLRGNMSALLTMLVLQHVERQVPEIQNRHTIKTMVGSMTKKKKSKE